MIFSTCDKEYHYNMSIFKTQEKTILINFCVKNIISITQNNESIENVNELYNCNLICSILESFSFVYNMHYKT